MFNPTDRDPGEARTGSYLQNESARPLNEGTGRDRTVLGDGYHSTGTDPLADRNRGPNGLAHSGQAQPSQATGQAAMGQGAAMRGERQSDDRKRDKRARRIAAAEAFLTILDEEAEGWCFQTFDDRGERRDLARTIHGTLPDRFDELDALNREGAGIFVTINEVRPGSPRKAENIIRVRAVFADFDPPKTAGPPPRYPLEPVMEVETSRGKRHVYWTADGVPLGDFSSMQRGIVAALNSDPAPVDLPRVMRLPGFRHMKDPADPHWVRVIATDPRLPYTPEALARAFPPVMGKDSGAKPDLRADPTARELHARGLVLGEKPGVGLYIRCPWESEHTTPSTPTGTIYYPPHTGGYAGRAFKCQHGHCTNRTADDLLRWLGLGPGADQGTDQGAEDPPPSGLFPSASERPCYCVLDDWGEGNGRRAKPGVYWCTAKEKDGEVELSETWFCSPVHVQAVTFDGQSNNFGRLLRFKNTLGVWREWAMPMELLRGSGDELRGELLAMGVELDPYKARQLLSAYLQHQHPKQRMHCALQTGWAGASFVLPDGVIGPTATQVIFQSGERGHDEHTRAGTLDGWRTEIAARAVGNPLLLLALSAGFAGPMLGRCNAEGGGLHFVGDSSTGKTTLIEAACSVWGGPNYRRSWRATANGMEGAAALFNDCLLALDEISECDPREIGAIVYSLGNGRGKQRASRSGAARGVVRWRCFVLSSGERTIATAMHEGGHRAKAGQAVRLLDVPAAQGFGAFDTLHELPSGAALADAIKRAAVAHHGHPGRAFLERLAADPRDFCALLEEVKALPMFAAADGEGQDKRAAARFALVGMSGELATEYGLTDWPEGEAMKAAVLAFDLWRSLRGKGNDERRQIMERVSGFVDRHGDGRFSNADAIGDGPMVRDRAGWWRETATGRSYLFTAEAMHEALAGFDFRRELDVLQEAGALEPRGSDGKRARFFRIGGRGVKLYPVNADKLDGGDHGA